MEQINEQESKQVPMDIIVIMEPGKVVKNNTSLFAPYWRGVMARADLIPQTIDDIADVRTFVEESLLIEGKISSIFELILAGDAKAQQVVSELKSLKEDSRELRLKLGGVAKTWTNNQKMSAVADQVEKIATSIGPLFSGRLAKARSGLSNGTTPRLEKAGKGKRTIETYTEAVTAEADLIVSEANQLIELCRANLTTVDATELPSLFPDWSSLMLKPEEQVASEIGTRVAKYELQEEKKKSSIKRNPERLSEFKAEAKEKDNSFHLNNWAAKHKARITHGLPHPDDIAELWDYCGELKATLKAKEAEAKNTPPPEDEPRQEVKPEPEKEPESQKSEQENVSTPDKKEGSAIEQEPAGNSIECEPGISFKFSVFVPGNNADSKKKATDLAAEIWKLVEDCGGSASVERD